MEPMMPERRENEDQVALRGGAMEVRAKPAAIDPRFDRWLSRRLHEAYDSVLREALPPELSCLVQQLAAREGAARHHGAADNDGEPSSPHPEERRHSPLFGAALQLRN
jgi:hypothetical protein